MAMKIVDSKVFALKEIFLDKYDVDFYQREYVWQTKQIEDLLSDLSNEFLKNWKPGDQLKSVNSYDPYFMGEIVLSDTGEDNKRKAIIDGQQRITTLTLILIYLLHHFETLPKFPSGDLRKLIYSDYYGEEMFNLDIAQRHECMLALLNEGEYVCKPDANPSIMNLVARYNDIESCWNPKIDEVNAVNFAYWLKEKVVFSKVWTNDDEFAYVIFETMNDRGLSLTPVEMLRSYLLANIDSYKRNEPINLFDKIIKKLVSIKLSSKSKAEFEFFKVYFRGHLAEDLSQSKNSKSDFTIIGKEFHRWLSDNSKKLGLIESADFIEFINKLYYFCNQYEKIYKLIDDRNAKDNLYLIVNNDYNFTLQTALILSSIKYKDPDDVVISKIRIISKYLTKVLTWKTWNHEMISQSSMEAPIYQLCKEIRDSTVDGIMEKLKSDPLSSPALNNPPILNQQIKARLKVMLSLITEIVARESGEPDYLLNKPDMEVEHIWSNHYDEHSDEFATEVDFANARNTIGDLLVLPKSFNASYNDDPYETKVVQYFSQNILAQSLNAKKYENNPGFTKFTKESGLNFKSYEHFKKDQITERTDLYRSILEWNFKD